MDTLIYSTADYDHLRDELVARHRFAPGAIERQRFPDGERYLRIASAPAGRHAVLLGGTVSDADTLEVFDLACALVKHGAAALTLVIPYFGYATMERATRPGEVVTAKCRARLLSAIPAAPGGNRVVLLDLHADGIAHYFEGGIRPTHLYAKSLVTELARRLAGGDFVLASTDAGRAKWVESLANDLGVRASFVFKRRLDGSRTTVTAVSAQVQGRTVVIYDDMIRTGGSLLGAARAYRDAGATRLIAIATHGLFPGDALERIHASGLFAAVACTDSHPRARALAGPLLTVAPITGLVAAALEDPS